MAFVAGAVLCTTGAWLEHSASNGDPVPVPSGSAVALPAPGPLGGRVGVYGVPSSATWPSASELGCSLQGSRPGTELVSRADGPAGADAADGPATMDRRVIAGSAVAPLLEVVPADGGGTLTCTRTVGVAPVFVVPTSGVRDLAPMAAFSLASLALVVGGAGLLTLRPEED